MATSGVALRIAQEIRDRITVEREANGIIYATVSRENLVSAVQYVRDSLGGRFIISIGTDKRELSGYYEVNNVFGLDRDKLFLLLKTDVDPADPNIDSITPLIPGAD
jgi:Ni,Fe-hydrogenase III component G